MFIKQGFYFFSTCLLYTSDAADERSSVDLGGRRIIKNKNQRHVDVTLVAATTAHTDEDKR